MTSHDKKIWFPAKRYGWGWGNDDWASTRHASPCVAVRQPCPSFRHRSTATALCRTAELSRLSTRRNNVKQRPLGRKFTSRFPSAASDCWTATARRWPLLACPAP